MTIKVWNLTKLINIRTLYENEEFGIITDFLVTP
jgi:hypothetical protein